MSPVKKGKLSTIEERERERGRLAADPKKEE